MCTHDSVAGLTPNERSSREDVWRRRASGAPDVRDVSLLERRRPRLTEMLRVPGKAAVDHIDDVPGFTDAVSLAGITHHGRLDADVPQRNAEPADRIMYRSAGAAGVENA